MSSFSPFLCNMNAAVVPVLKGPIGDFFLIDLSLFCVLDLAFFFCKLVQITCLPFQKCVNICFMKGL